MTGTKSDPQAPAVDPFGPRCQIGPSWPIVLLDRDNPGGYRAHMPRNRRLVGRGRFPLSALRDLFEKEG